MFDPEASARDGVNDADIGTAVIRDHAFHLDPVAAEEPHDADEEPGCRSFAMTGRRPLFNTDIRDWIETWSQNPRPYIGTKTTHRILESISCYCRRINDSRH